MKNLLSLFLFFLCSSLIAQYHVPKFGDIDINDLKMTRYEKDTTADALILFDNGSSSFELNENRQFDFMFERHLRIKIFRKSGFRFADVPIRLYRNNQNKEKLVGLKAVTYNLVNDKIVKTKLNNNNIYETEDKRYIENRFAFPEVKEGSIIELEYTIISDYLYDLRGWNFQYSCPALLSQYSTSIPEYFDYRRSAKGYLRFDIATDKKGKKTYIVHYDSELPTSVNGSRTPAANYNLDATTNEDVLAVKDVPAFIAEPDIDCISNYMESIEFELSSVQYPSQMRKDFTSSWESVNKEMFDDEDFGGLLNSGKLVADTVTKICSNVPTELEKARAIYNYVIKRMKWNGDYGLWASKGLKKPFTERTGNSAEINLLLALMLQTAGIKAYPVIFSTRSNGIALAVFPTISKFNSVITRADIGGKTYLLDAVSKYCPFGVLPADDLNGTGRVVDNLNGNWVELNSPAKYIESKKYSIAINSEGKMEGLLTESFDGYAGISFRKRIDNEAKGPDDYFRKMQEDIKGLTINSFSITDRYDINKRVLDSLKIELADNVDLAGDRMLFYPLLFERTDRNRYTLEDRKYPVNYTYPISRTLVFEYTIPEGYSVESMPQSAIFRLPDNSMSVSYSVQSAGNKITVIYVQDINKTLFLPDEYKNLKAIYDQIVKKHSEQVILKKA